MKRRISLLLAVLLLIPITVHGETIRWVDFAVKKFPECKLILTGVSMGASTVLMAAAKPLPENVVGVLADCGFTSAREIMYEVIKQMGLPPKVSYPFVKLGAKLFGGFDLDSGSAIEAADAVIVSDDITRICDMITVARRTNRIAKDNIVLALGIKLGVIGLISLGFGSMWLAVFADVGVAVLAILNSMRTLLVKKNAK